MVIIGRSVRSVSRAVKLLFLLAASLPPLFLVSQTFPAAIVLLLQSTTRELLRVTSAAFVNFVRPNSHLNLVVDNLLRVLSEMSNHILRLESVD